MSNARSHILVKRCAVGAIIVAVVAMGYVTSFSMTVRVADIDYFGHSPVPDPPDFALAFSENTKSNDRAKLVFAPLIAILESTGAFEWDDSGCASEGWSFFDRFVWRIIAR